MTDGQFQEHIELHGKQIADQIEAGLLRVTGEFEGIVGAVDAAQAELENHNWTAGMDKVRTAKDILRTQGPNITDVAKLIGEGARAVRAAVQQNDGVGEKKSVTERDGH